MTDYFQPGVELSRRQAALATVPQTDATAKGGAQVPPDHRRKEWEYTRKILDYELAVLEERIGSLARLDFVRRLYIEAFGKGMEHSVYLREMK